MKIVIVEDELPAYTRLSKIIKEEIDGADILQRLDSVRGANEWFAANPQPDVVFMDINLSDGTAFDLLKMTDIDCPIIFTTAHDQYAIDAFKTSGIDYLLKPVKKEDLQGALKKLKKMDIIFGKERHAKEPAAQPGEYKKRFVIRFGEHIKTIATEDIAYCFSENKATYARTFENRTYPMDHNLDSLETMLHPDTFFRVNRQYIINLKSIEEMKIYSKARVIITLNPPVKEQPVVSSEKAAAFKHWLGGE